MANPNGNQPDPAQANLGAGDKFIVIILDDVTQTLSIVPNNLPDPDAHLDILYSALGAVIQNIKAAKAGPKSNLITLLPGTRLRG